jgi:hypothetical protein
MIRIKSFSVSGICRTEEFDKNVNKELEKIEGDGSEIISLNIKQAEYVFIFTAVYRKQKSK